LEHETVLYYEALLRYNTVFSRMISVQTKYIALYDSVVQIREELHYNLIASFLIDVVSAIKLQSPAFTALSDLATVVIFIFF
jgi:hypothetical protein